jgi:outer membrane protein assembly factor BamE
MPRLPFLMPALLAAALLATGCESLQRTDSFLGVITPYRIDIVQGNAITKEQLAAVRPGMSAAQVREILGTPLVTDPFHAQRWDYVFTLRRDGTAPQRRNVVALFEGDKLKSIAAPELPSEREFVATISRQRNLKPPKLDLTEDERRALPPPVRQPAPAAEPMGPVRAYPPLEI